MEPLCSHLRTSTMVRYLALCAFICISAQAQSSSVPAPQYDLVTSIKPNTSVDVHIRIRMDKDAIFIQDASLKDLLSNTYGLRASLIFNLPRWAEDQRFDIPAKLLTEDSTFFDHFTAARRREIFERLLQEQFGIVDHKETRTLPVYELVQSGKGTQLIDNPPPPPSDKPEPIKPGHNSRGNTSLNGTHIDATGIRISDFCGTLGRVLDRTVIDKTGLTSFYDITLNWSDEHSDPSETGPFLFSALQEQLGLKLVPSKGPVEVLVLDKASPPKLNE